jgi:hypothetical protein
MAGENTKVALPQGGSAITFNGYSPVTDLRMVAAAAGANVCEVTISARDLDGNLIAGVHQFDIWLSDDADGQGHTATTASGTVQAKSASGTVVAAEVAKKAIRLQTLKTGIFVLEITDTAKSLFKVCAKAPFTGKTVVGITLTAAQYG